jgi:hypothetical protein
MIHIGFTGTQKGLTRKQNERLRSKFRDYLLEYWFLHHGDCIGGDDEADTIGKEYNAHRIIHPPLNPIKRAFCNTKGGDYSILPEKDYIPRNHDIVDSVSKLIACPKEKEEQLRSGTWATIRYARKKKLPIFIIYPNGDTESINCNPSC